MPPGKKVCSACRTVNEASSAYCYNCGVALPAQIVAGVEALGNPAGFWIRAVAYIIDNILTTVFGAFVLILLTGAEASEVWGQVTGSNFGSATIVSEGLSAAYFTFTIGKWGQTVGKALLGLKVTRVDGSGLTYWRSFARYWAYYLSIIPLLLGFLVIAFTSHKRGLHDYVCDTRVVKPTR